MSAYLWIKSRTDLMTLTLPCKITVHCEEAAFQAPLSHITLSKVVIGEANLAEI